MNGDDVTWQVEAYSKLAESARDRFKSRREMEWRVSLALWSAFGAGFVGVLTARSWEPSWWDILGAFALSSIIICIYAFAWLPYLHDRGQREIHQGIYWESHLQNKLGIHLPQYAGPPANNCATAANTNADGSFNGEGSDPRKLHGGLHRALWLQLSVTIFFACLFVGAISSRVAFKMTNETTAPGSRVLIEGNVEIDSVSKIKTK
ncbi:MAG: hypothetical protein L0211_03555 [Planctomycetaceae bacterium]|nr:hypothetical protein [Planctomycetaceae bacterium]